MSSVQRLTWHWPSRIVMPRSNISIIGIGSTSPPYTPLTETVPPRRTDLMQAISAASRSIANLSVSGLASASGSMPTALIAVLAIGEPCASMPTASTVPSAPRPSVRSKIASGDVVDGVEVDDLHAVRAGEVEALGDPVHADDPTAGVAGRCGR